MDIFAPLNPPAPLLALPYELQQQAKIRIQHNLSQIVKRLSGTVFYSESPSLSGLRSVLGESAQGEPLHVADTDEQIFHKFSRNVPFTSYDDYYPYVSRLIGEAPHATEIEHLLAPGLPDFVARTTGTTGLPKYFPKYPKPLASNRPRWDAPEASMTVKIAQLTMLGVRQFISVTGRDGETLPRIPLTIFSIGSHRRNLGIGPEDDADIATKKASFMTSPWAAWLLPTYTCTIHAQAFFSILDKSTVVIKANFPAIVIDSIAAIRAQWNNWIDAISSGVLPDFPNLPEERRQQLQAHLQTDVVRAEELRQIDISKEGWLKEVWPALEVVYTPLSGSYYGTNIRKIRYHFGPTVVPQSALYAATECMVGAGYDRMNPNLYRIKSDPHIELRDVGKEHHIGNISQLWEGEVGKRYEVLCTNDDGMWRYALGDIVEVAGFSPTDGQPLIRYVERQGVGSRLYDIFVSQETLQGAVHAAETVLCSIVDYTVIADERNATRAYGFLLELDGEIGPDAHLARSTLQNHLCTNTEYRTATNTGLIASPTIRVLAPGSFCAYRERVRYKVPCTITDPELKEWFLTKVVKEF